MADKKLGKRIAVVLSIIAVCILGLCAAVYAADAPASPGEMGGPFTVGMSVKVLEGDPITSFHALDDLGDSVINRIDEEGNSVPLEPCGCGEEWAVADENGNIAGFIWHIENIFEYVPDDSGEEEEIPAGSELTEIHCLVGCPACNRLIEADITEAYYNTTDYEGEDHIHKYEVKVVNAGCEENGYSTAECACGDIIEKYNEMPMLGHILVRQAANPSTCSVQGNAEHYICSRCEKYFSAVDWTQEIASILLDLDPTNHNMTHHEAIFNSCTESGNVEYWHCTYCDKNWDSEEGTNEIEDVEEAINPNKHTLIHTEGIQNTCSEPGRAEYWTCEKCGNVYSDAQCTRLVEDMQDLDLPTDPNIHSLTHHPFAEATCLGDGNPEYWHCEWCGLDFADSTGVAILGNVITSAPDNHNITHSPSYQDCGTGGVVENWHCEWCGRYWKDAELTKETDRSSVVLPAFGTHHTVKLRDIWYCEACGTCFADEEAAVQISPYGDDSIQATDSRDFVWRYDDTNKTAHMVGYTGTDTEIVVPISVLGSEKSKTVTVDDRSYIDSGGLYGRRYRVAGIDDTVFTALDGDLAGSLSAKVLAACKAALPVTVVYPLYMDPSGVKKGICEHSFVYRAPVTEACDHIGYREYWQCRLCGEYAEDENGEALVSNRDYFIISTDANIHDHELKHSDLVLATCCETGMEEYWECEACGKFTNKEPVQMEDGRWLTEDLQVSTDPFILETDPTLHASEPGRTEHQDSVCNDIGHAEYWQCPDCSMFTGEEPVSEEPYWRTTDKLEEAAEAFDLPLDYLHHHGEMIYVEAVTPTCATTGNKEYWKCEECGWCSDEASVLDENGNWSIPKSALHKESDFWLPVDPHYHLEALTQTFAVTPSCQNTGNLDYWYCSICGKYVGTAPEAVYIEEIVPPEEGDPENPDPETGGDEGDVIPPDEADIEDPFAEDPDPGTGGEDGEDPADPEPDPEPEIRQILVGWRTSGTISPSVSPYFLAKDTTRHPQTMTHMSADAPYCTHDGHLENWKCELCGQYSIKRPDAQTVTAVMYNPAFNPELPVSEENVPTVTENKTYQVVPSSGIRAWSSIYQARVANKHPSSLSRVAFVQETCIRRGNEQYWKCNRCGYAYGSSPSSSGGFYFTSGTAHTPSWFNRAINRDIHRKSAIVSKSRKDGLCDATGWDAHSTCNDCGAYWCYTGRFQEFSNSSGSFCDASEAETVTWSSLFRGKVPYQHSLAKIHAEDSTDSNCVDNGFEAHWYCTACGLYWPYRTESLYAIHTPGDLTPSYRCGYTSDAIGLSALRKGLAPTVHKYTPLEHTAAVRSTCTATGHIEYWTCSACHKRYSDAKGTAPLTTDITTDRDPHYHSGVLTWHDQVDPSCNKSGTEGYWDCSRCHKLFTQTVTNKQTSGTIYSSTDELKIDPAHDLKYVAYIKYCVEPGWKTHYVCKICGRYFWDSAGKQQTTIFAVMEESFGSHEISPTVNGDGYYQCSRCSAQFTDPDGEDEVYD